MPREDVQALGLFLFANPNPNMNKWKLIVQKSQSDRYQLPAGAVTRAQMAKMLDCEESKVDDITRDAREMGLIKKENRKVYNQTNKRVDIMSVYFDMTNDRGEKISK